MSLQFENLFFRNSLESSRSSYRSNQNTKLQHKSGETFETFQFRATNQKQQVIEKETVFQEKLPQYIKICEWRASRKDKIIALNKVMMKSVQQEKIQLKIYRDAFPLRITDIQLVSLSQLVDFMENSVSGFKMLDEYFGTFKITQEMFAIGKDRQCRVWINEAYCKNQFQIQSNWDTRKCRVLNIFKNICLSTVLAQQYFEYLKKSKSFAEMQGRIEKFKKENQLGKKYKKEKDTFIKKGNELSFSSRKKKGLLSSQSLLYSQKHVEASSKLGEAKSKKLQLHHKSSLTTNSSRSFQNIETYQSKHLQELSSLNSSNSSIGREFNLTLRCPMMEDKKKNISLETQVINHFIPPFSKEETAQEVQEKNQRKHKAKKLESFCRVVDEKEESDFEDQSSPILFSRPRKFNKEIDESEYENSRAECEKIIKNNGWSTKMLGLLDNEAEVQESLNYGGQVNRNLNNIKLHKLERLGKEMTMSIISNPEQE